MSATLRNACPNSGDEYRHVSVHVRLPCPRPEERASAVFLVQKRERTEKASYHGREPRRHRRRDDPGGSEAFHHLAGDVQGEPRSHPSEHQFPHTTKAEEP